MITLMLIPLRNCQNLEVDRVRVLCIHIHTATGNVCDCGLCLANWQLGPSLEQVGQDSQGQGSKIKFIILNFVFSS